VRRNRHFFSKRIAQALVALLFTLFIAESAFAADSCECPACPSHAYMHAGCANGNDGAPCMDVSVDACTSAASIPLARSPVNAILTFGTQVVVSAAGPSDGSSLSQSPNARRMQAPRSVVPPAHIVFCRLLR